MISSTIKHTFKEFFNREPLIVQSPGRINLIGEHTDYNEGFVLPAAINKKTVFALSENNSSNINLYAKDLDESFACDLKNIKKTEVPWANYLLGVVSQLTNNGYLLNGFNCIFGSDIPIGAGLSSSAALECGLAVGLNELFQLDIDPLELVKMCQKAEHQYAGVKCGIMDQFICIFGKKGHALRLDCRSLEYEYFLLDMPDYHIVLCDTGIRHTLAGSEYNNRRRQCRQGVAVLKKYYPEILNLRDVKPEMIYRHKQRLEPVVFKRCEYVVSENRRVKEACKDLDQGDLISFGKKMYLSHDGLKNGYEVSCRELDFLVAQTFDDMNVLGARMMGGGFGGCTVNIVKKTYAPAFMANITSAYKERLGIELQCHTVTVCDGARIV